MAGHGDEGLFDYDEDGRESYRTEKNGQFREAKEENHTEPKILVTSRPALRRR